MGADGWEEFCDGLVEGFLGSCFCRAELLLELRPCFLDGIEVRRVRRQVEQFGSCRLDPFADAGHFMRAEVVHHDHVSGLEGRAEHVVEVGQEDFGIRGRFHRHRRDHAVHAHRTQDRKDLPVAFGRRF